MILLVSKMAFSTGYGVFCVTEVYLCCDVDMDRQVVKLLVASKNCFFHSLFSRRAERNTLFCVTVSLCVTFFMMWRMLGVSQ